MGRVARPPGGEVGLVLRAGRIRPQPDEPGQRLVLVAGGHAPPTRSRQWARALIMCFSTALREMFSRAAISP